MRGWREEERRRGMEETNEPDNCCHNQDVDQFFQFIASDASEAAKADVIAGQWMKFCQTCEEVEAVFYSTDILKGLEENKSLLTFLCFAIMNSDSVRSEVIDRLLHAGELFTSLAVLPIPEVLMILTSCSVNIVANDEMKFILDYVLSLPKRISRNR